MAQTGASAYTRLQVPEDNLNQAIQFWGSKNLDGLANRKAADAAKAAARQAALDEELKKYALDPEKFKVKDNGYKDLNRAQVDLSREIITISGERRRMGEQALRSGDRVTAEKLLDSAIRLESQFENQQVNSATQKAGFEAYTTAAAENKVSGYSKGLDKFYEVIARGDGAKGQIRRTINENDDIVSVVDFKEDDGTVSTIIVPDDYLNSGQIRHYEKQDVPTYTTKIVEGLAQDIRKGSSGVIDWSRQQWGKKQIDATKEQVAAALNDRGFMADMVDQFNLYEEFKISENNPPLDREFTDAEKAKVEEKLIKMVQDKYSTNREDLISDSRYNGNLNRAENRRKEEQQKAARAKLILDQQGNATQILNEVKKYNPETKTWESTGDKRYQGKIQQFEMRKLNGDNPEGIVEKHPDATVQQIIRRDDGRFALQFSVPTKESNTNKVESLTIGGQEALMTTNQGSANSKNNKGTLMVKDATDGEIQAIATFYGLKNRDELNDYLNKEGGAMGATSTAPTQSGGGTEIEW